MFFSSRESPVAKPIEFVRLLIAEKQNFVPLKYYTHAPPPPAQTVFYGRQHLLTTSLRGDETSWVWTVDGGVNLLYTEEVSIICHPFAKADVDLCQAARSTISCGKFYCLGQTLQIFCTSTSKKLYSARVLEKAPVDNL